MAPTKDAGRRGSFNPPTVAETKQKFLDAYDKPVSSLYNTVVQELLVQQHFMRHNSRYQYDEVRILLEQAAHLLIYMPTWLSDGALSYMHNVHYRAVHFGQHCHCSAQSKPCRHCTAQVIDCDYTAVITVNLLRCTASARLGVRIKGSMQVTRDHTGIHARAGLCSWHLECV